MSKSIMHNKQDGTCYLCMLLNHDYDRRYNLEEHHAIEGNPGRKLSEHYGLKVYLCMEHHRTSKEAVHKNGENRRKLERAAQLAFEKKYSHEMWMEVFGRNYIL